MKKLFLSFAFIGSVAGLWAQEAADKKIQAGLVAGYGLTIQSMNTKYMESNGVGSEFTLGANANFSFTETIGFSTGLEFDFATLKYKAGNESIYYNYQDSKILTQQEAAEANEDQLFQLTSRKQKPIYLTIPTMLIFRTKFIGYFRYFGKFGLRSSFLLSNKTEDEGFNFPTDVNPILEDPLKVAGKNENMTSNKNDMIFFKSSVGAAGGAEWNFTGSTTLMAEIGYYYGFMPLYWSRKNAEDRLLYTTNDLGVATNESFFTNLAKQSQVMFKLSILF